MLTLGNVKLEDMKVTIRRRTFRWFALIGLCCTIVVFAGSCSSPAGLRLDADSLARLPAGATAHPTVVAAADDDNGRAIQFSQGGITLTTAGRLTPAAGTITLDCRTPALWPVRDDRTLFFARSGSKAEVSLVFGDGGLVGRYGNGQAPAAEVHSSFVRSWKPLSWHHVELSWLAQDSAVTLFLSMDGQFAANAAGRLIADWPAVCTVGSRGSEAPWQGLMREVVLDPAPSPPREFQPGRRTITVAADQPVGDCYRFWNISTYYYSPPILLAQPGGIEAMREQDPFMTEIAYGCLLGGMRRFHPDWFRGIGPGGEIQADFSGMIAELRAIVEAGCKPIVILDKVPEAMSDEPREGIYGNPAPPTDERVWGRYVQAAVEAMVQAFGRDAVAAWSFRVSNEPDNRAHWAGTREQYFAHYDYTVAALRRVLPEARVGPGNILNPAEARTLPIRRNPWGLDIIDHAAAGDNACTGGKGAPMSFFSCSWYSNVNSPVSNFDLAVKAMRDRLNRYRQFANLDIEIGEFAVLSDERGRRLYAGDASEWSASFFAAIADRVYRYNVAQVYQWDEATSGILQPRGEVIQMLERMAGGRRLAVEAAGQSAADCGAIACRKDDSLFVLLYNHRQWRQPQVAESVHLVVSDARMKSGGAWRLSEWSIDQTHGVWAYEFEADCAAAGVQPLARAGLYEGSVTRLYGEAGVPVFRRNADKYARLAATPQTRNNDAVTTANGQLTMDLDLPGHSVRLLQLTPLP